MPGSEQLLSVLIGRVSLAVASNGPRDIVRTALNRAGLDRFVNTIVSAETNGALKPLPDVYLAACRQLGVDPSNAIALEDSAVGRGARAAGPTVVVVGVAAGTREYADLAVPRLDDTRVFEVAGS
jgi:HAD superfamily hydrolase (TIGR01509 family)